MLFFVALFVYSCLFANIHEVLSGETLFSISRKYQTTVEQIRQINKIQNNSIYVGQKLHINTTLQEGKSIEQKQMQGNHSTQATTIPQSFAFPIKHGKIFNNHKGRLQVRSKDDRTVLSACTGRVVFREKIAEANMSKFILIIQCANGYVVAYQNLEKLHEFKQNERVIASQVVGEASLSRQETFLSRHKNHYEIYVMIIAPNKQIVPKPEKIFQR